MKAGIEGSCPASARPSHHFLSGWSGSMTCCAPVGRACGTPDCSPATNQDDESSLISSSAPPVRHAVVQPVAVTAQSQSVKCPAEGGGPYGGPTTVTISGLLGFVLSKPASTAFTSVTPAI